jgi:hypothetical protein
VIDGDIFNRVFDSEFFATQAIRNPRSVAKALCDIHNASHSDKAFPEEVRLAWQALYDVAGRELTGTFLSNFDWRQYVPDVSDDRDSHLAITLWTNGEKSVRVRLVYIQDHPQDLRFTIEDAASEDIFS